MFVEEAVDDWVDEGGWPGEDIGDHVEPAQGGGRDGVEDGEDGPGGEAEQEADEYPAETLGQVSLPLLCLFKDGIWSNYLERRSSIFSCFSCFCPWSKQFSLRNTFIPLLDGGDFQLFV